MKFAAFLTHQQFRREGRRFSICRENFNKLNINTNSKDPALPPKPPSSEKIQTIPISHPTPYGARWDYVLIFFCEQESVMCSVVYDKHLFCHDFISQQYVFFRIRWLLLSMNNLLNSSAIMVCRHQFEHLQVVTLRKESCIVYAVKNHQLLCRRYSFAETVSHICCVLKPHFYLQLN